VRVGRLVKSSVGSAQVAFAVRVNATAARALRRHRKLTLTVRLTIITEAGDRDTASPTVTLHHG
jgi:hypothetical protein